MCQDVMRRFGKMLKWLPISFQQGFECNYILYRCNELNKGLYNEYKIL